jgi:hypothetical protein
MNVVMLFDIISKDLIPDDNNASPLGQRVRGQAPFNFMMTN